MAVMVFDTQSLRDLLALARLLRQYAGKPDYAATKDQLLAAALALENRALCMAEELPEDTLSPEQFAELHAPVNLRI